MLSSKKNLLIISYNRPDKLKKVMKNIDIKFIKKIFFYNNAPYDEEDKVKTNACRKLILDYKFYGTKKYFFNKEHLNVKNSIHTAINWFFKNVKEGMILEDDIIPSKSFYLFCSNLLDHYRKNKNIFHISGFNHLEKIDSEFSYHYSQITHVWGWATWRDRWDKFNIFLKKKNIKKLLKRKLFVSEEIDRYRKYLYKQVLKNNIITLDYLWDFFIRTENGFNIRPNLNLVKNIGFDLKATNTKFNYRKKESKIRTFNLNKINYCNYFVYNSQNDLKYFNIYEKRNLLLKSKYDPIIRKIKKII